MYSTETLYHSQEESGMIHRDVVCFIKHRDIVSSRRRVMHSTQRHSIFQKKKSTRKKVCMTPSVTTAHLKTSRAFPRSFLIHSTPKVLRVTLKVLHCQGLSSWLNSSCSYREILDPFNLFISHVKAARSKTCEGRNFAPRYFSCSVFNMPKQKIYGVGMSQDDMMKKDQCILLDEDDNVTGAASKVASHQFNKETPRGLLHRAFSERRSDNLDWPTPPEFTGSRVFCWILLILVGGSCSVTSIATSRSPARGFSPSDRPLQRLG